MRCGVKIPRTGRGSLLHVSNGCRLQVVGQERRGLGGDNHSGNGGRGKGSEDTRDQSRDSQSRDISSTLGSELTQDTDLNTEGTDVTESTTCVGGDKLGSSGQIGVFSVRGESCKGVVLVLQMSICASQPILKRIILTVTTFSAMSLATLIKSSPSRLTPNKNAIG